MVSGFEKQVCMRTRWSAQAASSTPVVHQAAMRESGLSLGALREEVQCAQEASRTPLVDRAAMREGVLSLGASREEVQCAHEAFSTPVVHQAETSVSLRPLPASRDGPRTAYSRYSSVHHYLRVSCGCDGLRVCANSLRVAVCRTC